MRFTAEEIEMARQLRRLGLPWEPQPGHYVYDETAVCRKGSPFQDRVYFILNYDYFMNQVGGVDRFKQIMLWLPTWQDARYVLRSLGFSNPEVQTAGHSGFAAFVSSIIKGVANLITGSCYIA